MSPEIEGFPYRFEPGAGPGRTLLLLHGTGGDEHDLIALGALLDPDAARLAPRGRVVERGMPRWFRRLGEGVFDLEDLASRTDELARFVGAATAAHGLDPRAVVAAGYSNGANVAASLLLRHPGVLAGAVLFRPMVPFEPDALPALAGVEVFVGAGLADPVVPASATARLVALLESAGASVTRHDAPGGHALERAELLAAAAWLARHAAPHPG